MKRIVIFMLIIFVSNSIFAQEQEKKFPYPLLPDQDSITLPAFSDTVWILTKIQFDNFIKLALRHEIDSSLAFLQNQKVNLISRMCIEKDSLVTLNRKGYIHYRDLWTETDRKLERAEIENANKWKLGLYGFCVGVGLSSLLLIAIK